MNEVIDMAEDFIDITPVGVDGGKGQAGRTSTVFQNSEWDHIENKGKEK